MGLKISIKEYLRYIMFGVLTTLVNITIFYVLNIFEIDYKLNTSISNFISILFAYITNKIFVFKSKNWKLKFLLKEFIKFFITRLGTYFLDILGMVIFIEVLYFNNLKSKTFISIVIVILNYIFSKIIFLNQEEGEK
ncbi:GtrA family protein [Fusobacterium sp.]|uniref:GtrA family protein n=1 Tax=Fusobacterium TaxID=848 RepID=UPI000E7FE073|nr:teichoic acid glycosylation protein [Fusobacterium sp.]